MFGRLLFGSGRFRETGTTIGGAIAGRTPSAARIADLYAVAALAR